MPSAAMVAEKVKPGFPVKDGNEKYHQVDAFQGNFEVLSDYLRLRLIRLSINRTWGP